MNFLPSEIRVAGVLAFLLLPALLVLAGSGWAQGARRNLPSTSNSPAPDWSADGQLGKQLATLDVGANPPPLPAEVVIGKLMAASARRSAELRGYRGTRLYHLEYRGLWGPREATMQVAASYTAPEERNYSIISETGSRLLLNRVLVKLLDSEREAFRNQRQIELSPANYRFRSLGIERSPGCDPCYALAVQPRQDNRFLYRGKIWVDPYDFAMVRMEGQPVKSPSFWIKDTQILSNWERIGDFWLIQHSRSVSHIRMGGLAMLTVDYQDYQITGVGKTQVPAFGPQLPSPASITPER